MTFIQELPDTNDVNYGNSFCLPFSIDITKAKQRYTGCDNSNTIKETLDKLYSIKDQNKKLNNALQEHSQMRYQMEEIHKMMNVLMESDRNDIKAWITEKHHYFCYEKGYIDDYSLDCLERRFASYEKEDGNSFVETLMNEIRALPKVSKADKK